MKKNAPPFDLAVINPRLIIRPMIPPTKGQGSINETYQFAIAGFHSQILQTDWGSHISILPRASWRHRQWGFITTGSKLPHIIGSLFKLVGKFKGETKSTVLSEESIVLAYDWTNIGIVRARK